MERYCDLKDEHTEGSDRLSLSITDRTLLLVPPAGSQGEELLSSYLALAKAVEGRVKVHWAGYQQAPGQIAFKAISRFLATHPNTTVISHCPLPEAWKSKGSRFILTLLPSQLSGLTQTVPMDDIWILDAGAMRWGQWFKRRLWHRPTPRRFDLWVPHPIAEPEHPPGYLFALSQRLSSGERELISEVAQVVAIQRQVPVYLWLRGTAPPSLRGVTLLPGDDEALLVQHLSQALGVISDSWHRLLSGAGFRRPTLALTEPDTGLDSAALRMTIPTVTISRQGLTRAVLALNQAPLKHPKNQLEDAIQTLWPELDSALGSVAQSGYTSA
ncbi:hypothetical protein KUV89_15080 [Marinobacter hydrocarbonoclasticus]|nr:hypothetical protein [Marinobacter nauticus]